MSEEVKRLEEKLKMVIKERDSLFNEVEVAKGRMTIASKEADLFKNKLEAAMRRAKQREAELVQERGDLSSKAESSDYANEKLEERFNSLNQQLKTERENFLKQERELLELSREHRLQAEDDRRNMEKAERIMTKAIEEKELVSSRLEQAKRDIEEAARQRTFFEKDIEALEKKIESEVEKSAHLSKEIKLLKEREQIKDSSLKEEVAKDRSTIEDMRKRLGEETKLRAELESRLEAEIAKLNRRELDFEEKSKEFKEMVNRAKEEARQYQAQLLTSRHDLSELQVLYERLERKHNIKLKEHREDRSGLLGEIRVFEKKLATALEQVRDTEKQLSTEKRVAANQIEQLRSQMRRAVSLAEREKNELRKQVEVLSEKAEEVRLRGESFDQEIKAIRDTATENEIKLREELERKINALQKTAKAFEDETRRNATLEEQAVSLRKLLEDMERRLRSAQAETQGISKAHQKKISAHNEQQNELRQSYLELQNTHRKLTDSYKKSKDREMSLRSTLKKLRVEMDDMQESVSASSATKAYLKEKYEAVDNALKEVREKHQEEKNLHEMFEAALHKERETFIELKKEIQSSAERERSQLEAEHSREAVAYREELETLLKERDNARDELIEEHARNQELLQNLLAMRDELQMAQEASTAAKAFLKEKMRGVEAQLEEYRSEFIKEEQRRQELEKQLRDLRSKMEFA